MMLYQLFEGMLKLGIPVETYFWMYDLTLILIGLLGLVIYLFTWDVMWVWLMAWWKKKPIVLQWTKSKQWKFKIPTIDKGCPDALVLDNRKGIVELRREAVGLGPHKVPICIATSEFPAVLSPTELEGERYYSPTDSFYGVPFNDTIIRANEPSKEETLELLSIVKNLENKAFNENHPTYQSDIEPRYFELNNMVEAWKNRQLYVRYPSHTINVSEFVNYQKIAVNPELIASYAEDQVIEAKNDARNPLNSLNLQIMIPLIIVLAIAYMLMSQQNVGLTGYENALTCTSDYQTLLKECGKEVYNVSFTEAPKIGGMIK